MIPRMGEPVRPGQRYRLRPGAYAILLRRNQILLTAQMGDELDVQLPGGGIDPGESMFRALHREVLEETGWSIGHARRLGCFRRFVFMPEYDLWAEKLCHIFLARPVMRRSDPVEDDHVAFWSSIDAAMELVGNDGDRSFLMRWQRSEFG